MVVFLFLLSLTITGFVLSAVPSDDLMAHSEVDYHLVPFWG